MNHPHYCLSCGKNSLAYDDTVERDGELADVYVCETPGCDFQLIVHEGATDSLLFHDIVYRRSDSDTLQIH